MFPPNKLKGNGSVGKLWKSIKGKENKPKERRRDQSCISRGESGDEGKILESTKGKQVLDEVETKTVCTWKRKSSPRFNDNTGSDRGGKGSLSILRMEDAEKTRRGERPWMRIIMTVSKMLCVVVDIGPDQVDSLDHEEDFCGACNERLIFQASASCRHHSKVLAGCGHHLFGACADSPTGLVTHK